MKVAKTTLRRIWRLGRGTATVTGLAVLLALTVGLASTALAGTGVGARFDLGKVNVVNATSRLVGNVNNGPVLTVKNNSRTPDSEPLSLETTKTGFFNNTPPMKVDSPAKVDILNVDLLDGKDSTAFFSGETYVEDSGFKQGAPGFLDGAIAKCDPGDAALSGGHRIALGPGDATNVLGWETGANGHLVNFAGDVKVNANVTCADFPPLR